MQLRLRLKGRNRMQLLAAPASQHWLYSLHNNNAMYDKWEYIFCTVENTLSAQWGKGSLHNENAFSTQRYYIPAKRKYFFLHCENIYFAEWEYILCTRRIRSLYSCVEPNHWAFPDHWSRREIYHKILTYPSSFSAFYCTTTRFRSVKELCPMREFNF
jgi:hypothetical protein